MLVTIFYTVWILYTVTTLGGIILFISFVFWANWENARHQEQIHKHMSVKESEKW